MGLKVKLYAILCRCATARYVRNYKKDASVVWYVKDVRLLKRIYSAMSEDAPERHTLTLMVTSFKKVRCVVLATGAHV